MTQLEFEEYIYSVYGNNTGTAKSYITALHIVDEMFAQDDILSLNGTSITCIEDTDLLQQIADIVYQHQYLYKKGNDSIFRNINSKQKSYPGKGFCSAAMKQLLEYKYIVDERKADNVIAGLKNGKRISSELRNIFQTDKEGNDIEVSSTVRSGQRYFRKMVLENYNGKCCVTGLNIPTVLRASHISAWVDDKVNRMNPENGLCLSATYDAAFDKHLISFDDDYRLIISREIKNYYTNDIAKKYFGDYEGKQLILPKMYLPSKRLLEKHRDLMVV